MSKPRNKVRQPFSNTTMRAPRRGKPHIQFIDGWWRVSRTPKPYTWLHAAKFGAAHHFANKLNKKGT